MMHDWVDGRMKCAWDGRTEEWMDEEMNDGAIMNGGLIVLDRETGIDHKRCDKNNVSFALEVSQ